MAVADRIDVSSDPSEFSAPEWGRLVAQVHPRNVFATPEWQRAWWEERGEGKELLVLRLKSDDEVIAYVPLYRKYEAGKPVLRFVGGIDLTDYIGPICAPEDGDRVAAALVEWLEHQVEPWSLFDAHNLPVPAHFAETLVERADAAGFRFELEQEETSAVILLPRTWDDYLSSLKAKERHELKRKMRKLAREYPGAAVRETTPETLEADLQTFFHMHRGAEGLKGHFMRHEIATFFARVAHSFMPLGWLRLNFLEVEGRSIASTFGFELDGVYYLYNSAYEPDFASVSPGLVLCAHLIQESIDRGLDRFDFLRGPEDYKYRFGAEPIPLHNVRIFAGE